MLHPPTAYGAIDRIVSADQPPAEPRLPLVSVIIPLYREGSHIESTIQVIKSNFPVNDYDYEIILVDDGSPDSTWDVITQQNQTCQKVRGLRLSRNFGKEGAIAAGLDEACGEVIIVMDGDLQHPPQMISAMLAQWAAGAEIVDCVKDDRGRENWQQSIRAWLFYRFFTISSGFDLHGASDFKLLDRKVVDAWRLMGERNLFFRGMSAWLGFRRVSIPFVVQDRIEGQSSWSLMKLIRLATTAITSFSSAPLYAITLLGMVFIVFSIALALQTLYKKITGYAIDGFTTVILLELIQGGCIMLALGLIGTYISKIYDEVKARPRYIVAERTKS